MLHVLKNRLACTSSWLTLTQLVVATAVLAGASTASAQAASQTLAANTPPTTSPVTASDAGASDAATSDTSTSSQVGEITVTARLREENIQKVPETMVALTPQVLQNNNIVNFYNMVGMAPSVDFYPNWVRDYGSIEIRGFPAAAYFNELPAQPYSLFDIGDVQILYGPQGTLFGYSALGGAVLYTSNHPELNHYGASIDLTEGNLNQTNVQGYVNIPIIQDHLAVRISFERDHTDGYTHVQGTSENLDSNDNEGLRIGVQWNPGNGRFTNYFVALADHQGDTETSEIPTYLNPLYAPYQLAGVTGSGRAYNNAGAEAANIANLCTTQILTTYWAPGTTAAQCQAQHEAVLNTFYQQTLQGIALAQSSGYRTVPAPIENAPVNDEADDYQVEDIANYDVTHFSALGGGDISVHNIALYRWFHNQVANFTTGAFDYYAASGYGNNIPVPPTSLLTAGSSVNPMNGFGEPSLGSLSHDASDEFQIHGALDTSLGSSPGLAWVVGFYNYWEGPWIGNGTSPNIPISNDGGLQANEGPEPSYYPKSYYASNYGQYLNATLDAGMFFKPLQGLQFTGGIRANENHSNYYGYPIAVDYSSPQPYSPNTAAPLIHTVTNNHPVNWSWQISYVTDSNLLYVSSAFIVVPGFANTPPSTVPTSAVPGFVPAALDEDLQDYEVGDKYHFDFNGVRGYVDFDAYHEALTHVQIGETIFVQTPTATAYVSYTTNPADEVREGIEFQGEVFPIPNLDIYANFSYAHDFYTQYLSPDPTYTDFYYNGAPGATNPAACVPGPSKATISPGAQYGTCIMDFKSTPLPYAPNVQASVRINYTIPMPNNIGDLVASFTANYTDKAFDYGGYSNVPLIREEELLGPGVVAANVSPAHTLINLRLTWNKPLGQQNLTAALFVTNLTDVTYKTGVLDFLFATGVDTANYGPPRQFGFEVIAKW
ncbi:MAG TPA: hypothetical protein VHW60_17605 [Caulobacteraceae bacterium]|jgi:outer membrane receptor protein involved in Fe transport|nr:hypothetical protein [Caulobacteraceae bacterium]